MATENPKMKEGLRGVFRCFFLSGLAGLVYQVAWGKALGLIFGYTTYAIATVLAVFMAGLACGSAFFGRWIKTRAQPILIYSKIEIFVGVAGGLSLAGLGGGGGGFPCAFPQ